MYRKKSKMSKLLQLFRCTLLEKILTKSTNFTCTFCKKYVSFYDQLVADSGVGTITQIPHPTPHKKLMKLKKVILQCKRNKIRQLIFSIMV